MVLPDTTTFQLPASAFPPLALGFMGLGTGYLIYGPQELFRYPRPGPTVALGTGIWGIWLPGLMQLVTGLYLFAGLTLFDTFKTPLLYMAALAFTAYGIHWFAIGWNRLAGVDPKVNTGMTVGYTLISILGIIVFFGGHDNPVGGLFIGLTGIYVSDFFAAIGARGPGDMEGISRPRLERVGRLGEMSLGIWHIGTGFWLMYLMFAVTLNFTLGYTLWV